jgi:Ca2+-binding EF-hand superfamily protein
MERIKAEFADKFTSEGPSAMELRTAWEHVISTRVLMITKMANQHVADLAGDSPWPPRSTGAAWERIELCDSLREEDFLTDDALKRAVILTYCVDSAEKADAVHLLHEHEEGFRLERRRAAAMKEDEEDDDEFDFEEADDDEDMFEDDTGEGDHINMTDKEAVEADKKIPMEEKIAKWKAAHREAQAKAAAAAAEVAAQKQSRSDAKRLLATETLQTGKTGSNDFGPLQLLLEECEMFVHEELKQHLRSVCDVHAQSCLDAYSKHPPGCVVPFMEVASKTRIQPKLESLLREQDPRLESKELFKKRYGLKRKEWTSIAKDKLNLCLAAWRVGLQEKLLVVQTTSKAQIKAPINQAGEKMAPKHVSIRSCCTTPAAPKDEPSMPVIGPVRDDAEGAEIGITAAAEEELLRALQMLPDAISGKEPSLPLSLMQQADLSSLLQVAIMPYIPVNEKEAELNIKKKVEIAEKVLDGLSGHLRDDMQEEMLSIAGMPTPMDKALADQDSLFEDRTAFDLVQAACLIQPTAREYLKNLVKKVKQRCKKIKKYTKRGDTDIDYNFAVAADAEDEDQDAENEDENAVGPNDHGTTEVEMVSLGNPDARGDAPVITVALKRSLAMQALSHDGPTNTAQLMADLKEALMLTVPLKDFASQTTAATARADIGTAPLQSASQSIDELVHFVGHISAFAIGFSLQGEEKKERLPEVAEPYNLLVLSRKYNQHDFSYPEEEQRAVAQLVFHELDADDSGGLDKDEFRVLCEKFGLKLTPLQLSAMFDEVDTDRDGDVDFEEFFAWFSKHGFDVDVGTLSAAKVNLIPTAEAVSPAVVAEVEPQMLIGPGADLSEGAGIGSDDVFMDIPSPKPAQEPEEQPRGSEKIDYRRGGGGGCGAHDAGPDSDASSSFTHASATVATCAPATVSATVLQDDLERQTARTVFDELDEDDSGMLDQGEFLSLCQRVGLSLNKVQAQLLFCDVDKDGSGELSFDEFFQWYTDNGFTVLTRAELELLT